MRSEREMAEAIRRHGDMVRRLCMVHLKNYADTEDIFQTVFLKYVLRAAPFQSAEHEKAWFIRVTINACRDLLRSFLRRPTVPMEAAEGLPAALPAEYRPVLEALGGLPGKYRDVVYLHDYEGYTAPQVGKLLGINSNTVYTRLARARRLLREQLGGEELA